MGDAARGERSNDHSELMWDENIDDALEYEESKAKDGTKL